MILHCDISGGKKNEQDQSRVEVYQYMHGSLKHYTSRNQKPRLFLFKHACVKLHPLPII